MAGVLAIVHGALGDTILALPALEVLAGGAGPLTVWGPARDRLTPLLAPRGPARAIRTFPPEALALWSEPAAPLPEAARAAVAPFERIVALCGPGPLAARVEALGGAVVAAPRAGEDLPGHATDVLLARVRAATGLSSDVDPRPRLAPTREDLARGRALAGAGRWVVCHPGSGGRAKCWSPDGFARALAALPDDLAKVVVLGPAEVERGLDAAAFAGARVVRAPSIDDLIALLGGAAGHLGNDAGPSHLAAALGAPTVAVFGPTDPARWAPRGRGPVAIVRGDLDALDPARVAAALRPILREPVESGPAFTLD
ncbi:MAG: hypothetical protein M9894_01490 [Planctomycetes bacterium]|nr:hypothetical protein [Planctomycetota bacterium]